jgi:hypothetical protein
MRGGRAFVRFPRKKRTLATLENHDRREPASQLAARLQVAIKRRRSACFLRVKSQQIFHEEESLAKKNLRGRVPHKVGHFPTICILPSMRS